MSLVRPPEEARTAGRQAEGISMHTSNSGRNVVVVGTQWGDEGKGKVVDWLTDHAAESGPDVRIGFDLADSSGYAYYSGARFAVYAEGASDAIARGGRYDEVGAIFGRTRPAVGFGLDVKEVAELVPVPAAKPAIRAPGTGDAGLRGTVRDLRSRGEVVVRQLSGDRGDEAGFVFDRELARSPTGWMVQGRTEA